MPADPLLQGPFSMETLMTGACLFLGQSRYTSLCLRLSGLLEQNATDCVVQKQRKCLSRRSRGRAVPPPGQGIGELGVWREPASWFMCHLSLCPHVVEGAGKIFELNLLFLF